MNRNKKTFPSGMRVAALYLLMGVLLLLAVTLFSGRESMRATEEYFDRTINFVKVQSTSYEKYNDTVTAKALRRMAVSVRQLAENDTLDLYDPEASGKKRNPSGLPALPYWTKMENHCANIRMVISIMRSLRNRCESKPR